MNTPVPSILYRQTPSRIPEPGAVAYGQDQYGYWQAFAVKGVVQRFRWIHPGSFWMGSPESDTDHIENELLHKVTLTQGFWLADTACSQGLWEAVMGEDENPSKFEGQEKPVDNVTWKKAKTFINKLSFKACLPSEAQWEYACRAGSITKFAFGNELDSSNANYYNTKNETVSVRHYDPNPWGLYQMHGNIWEWCEDWYGLYMADQQQDPVGPISGEDRVLRGGSWGRKATNCRSAFRSWNGPGDHINDAGFRLARNPEQKESEPR